MSSHLKPTMAKGAGAGRLQVALKPGHSLMDWVKLKNKKGPSLAGSRRQSREPITKEELAQHKGPEGEIWMAIRGYVFNVTPYLDFHPGGRAQLMKGAGKDATKLFDHYHPWVNVAGMLDNCCVGKLAP
ncbi:hypothetical protein PTSG_09057 [Salpingoeca rosetta]|uniref:Cytochrome b5 heme-binding domain-containing protein n=1 Tax=Salpingoeca rosetta (strain ATCC 50818 / BSB-021) TaxID=946362 RepID=F2UM31_SALR5|nr:uncharacterized protein PTSG_09057 [Salpingoeca rosetta]EGD78180.1 hypothetical protein PTSG_09057 [Salpingoeca rosetta]|eukprot:XP_004989856.1 hypothetical protein PTSG_09057 [Salpingoeca rosetta]